MTGDRDWSIVPVADSASGAVPGVWRVSDDRVPSGTPTKSSLRDIGGSGGVTPPHPPPPPQVVPDLSGLIPSNSG